jgi:hypothetical protein
MAVYSENGIKYINILCDQNVEFFNVKEGSYEFPLKAVLYLHEINIFQHFFV